MSRKITANLIGIIIITLLIAIFAYMPKVKSPSAELQELQIEKTKLSIKLLERSLNADVLTVDDLDAIYDCVDTRIENKHRKDEFPCTSVRGESF